MIYHQALKFLNTQVFAVLEDQTILRGLLTSVDRDAHAIIIVNKLNTTTTHRIHIKYVFPQK